MYEKPVISLAVLGDENASWSPSSYEYGLGGCRLSLEFPIIKLLKYESMWQVLESSTNPFAVVVMAHLKTKATHKQPMERKRWKWYLIRRLFEQGYSKNDIVDFAAVVGNREQRIWEQWTRIEVNTIRKILLQEV
ncbi:hypothetical protein [Moorena sp. SIO3B2]|uniref:hypothetical protein n=1 Tax=Moorena sp. SIO3B2 TaxID=2607827 RepID=UPI00257EDF28|nr:hypothetical protein [Moorena sp. SIO3B2]